MKATVVAAPSPHAARAEAARRRDLARMRRLATGLLLLMTAIFVATRLAPAAWTWTAYVQAFAEAGMVGACADWFAVTALFRRPLGLPIPHTGIIPRNKDRIGEALGDFIANNFLTPAVLDARLRRLEPARRLAAWLTADDHAEVLAARAAALLPDMIGAGAEMRGLAAELIRRAARSRPVAPLAARVLGWLWREPAVQRLVSRAIDRVADFGLENEAFIQSRISGETWKWLPKWVDRILAEKFTRDLLRAANELRDPDHPWRRDLDAAVEDFIRRLAEDPVFLERGEAMRDQMLADPALGRRLEGLWTELAERLAADPGARGALIAEALSRGLHSLGAWLAEDHAACDRLDRWIRVAARRTLSSQRQAIGGFVAQVVAGWDAGEITDRLELHVGRDLQYIRINGTLVGGLVGLAIFVISRWLS
ncbi:MAG TPA: DUF445 domain-containing protein [Caulobacteraceae bacterium]|nr:DUF445 domain-containing protein [Caulobacteraceae bacterium]